MATMDMTLYNFKLKMIGFKIFQPLPRLSVGKWIPNLGKLGILGEDKHIKDVFPRLRQKWKDLRQGHEDPERLGREVVRLHAQGLYANAVIAARRLADLQRERLGSQHPDYAAAIFNLGVLLQQQGNLDEARGLLTEALDLRRESLGESDPQYAAGLLQLADILQAQGDLDTAERLIRQALDIQRTTLGVNDPALAGSLTSHALLLNRRGDIAAAEPLLRRALAIRKDQQGERHPLYASALSNLALLLWRRGDDAEAESLLRRALVIRDEALGPNHPDSVETRDYLAAISEKGRSEFAQETETLPKADVPASPLHKLSAEYAEISRALAKASRLDDTGKAIALAEVSALAERCQRTLKEMMGQNTLNVDKSHEHRKQEPFTIVSFTATEDFRAGDEMPVPETPIVTPRPKRIEPSVPAPVPLETPRERDPVRVQALALLDRMLKVRSLNPRSSELLSSYLSAVGSLRQSLDESGEEPTRDDFAVVQHSHPVTALLRLADDKNLSNQDWLNVYGVVSETFGHPLATAASKGMILFPEETEVTS